MKIFIETSPLPVIGFMVGLGIKIYSSYIALLATGVR